MTPTSRNRRGRARSRSPATTATCGASTRTTTRSRCSTSARTATRRSPRSRSASEPWCVAITPDDRKAYVTNMASGTVSVIDAYVLVGRRHDQGGRRTVRLRHHARTASSSTSPTSRRIPSRSSTPGATASSTPSTTSASSRTASRITADGKQVYVTQFLALPRAGDPRPLTQTEGADDGREGRVTVIDAYSNQVAGTVAAQSASPTPDF